MEVVVGTYDQLLLGFILQTNENDQKVYQFEPKFVDRGHAGCVKSISNGGDILASGSTDEMIRLFSLKDHRELGSLVQHEGSVTCLTFCDNTHMLSASEDNTVCVWECQTWKCLKILKGHKRPVTSLSVHPSGRLALSVSKDKHLRTWNLITGRPAFVTDIKEVATVIKWSPSGESYAVVIGSKVVIYKLVTATLSFTFELKMPVLTIEFMEENVLVAGGESKEIDVIDIVKEECLQSVQGHNSRIKALEAVEDPFSDDEKRILLLSVSSDGDLRAWSFNPNNFKEDPRLVAQFEMNGRPTCLTIATKKRKPHNPDVKQDKPETVKSKAEKKEKRADRRSARSIADEPKKKKHKRKKKKPKLNEDKSSAVQHTETKENTEETMELEPAYSDHLNSEE